MGVPKFYRWISERYPCLSELIKEHEVPDFDNLYLDMNGIIHICSHPNDNDPHFRITEEQIYKDIFHYIEALFRIVKPKKVFFLAVDGVAPRAKMNQQRGRRFRSIREAETNVKKAIARGEVLPEEKRFDSNCITPGTKFMIRLQHQLEYFVQDKITNDDSWKGLRVYLSGHETPGEGEHKIMEFIRYERSQEGYDANTRHCLYGLDADLMMLGLCSHEPHFSLLREEVRFGKKNQINRPSRVEDTNFHLLHLSLMREYIDHEFEELKMRLPFEYDVESIIDDWVLMGFLVGNDFVPHLPNLHIAHNSLPYLYQAYIRVLPKLDGYLNEGGIINLKRFQVYLDEISVCDLSKFEENYSDFRWLESKRNARKMKDDEDGILSGLNGPSRQHSESSLNAVKELARRQGLLSAESSDTEADYQDDEAFQSEFLHNKRAYYCDKLKLQGTDEDIATVCKEYIRAMQWICHYYYNGVQSWSWFYPYHYAPYMSDLRDIQTVNMTFDFNTPFLPYEQLLAVLPPGSKECIPEVYWDLMCSEQSAIIEYYPEDFECDLNGKQQEWEAVVCIPFIDETRLLSAMALPNSNLTETDRKHNRHSDCQLYEHEEGLSAVVHSTLPSIFPNLQHCSAKKTMVPLKSWISTDTSVFKKGLLKGTKLSTYFPGFPTLHHIEHSAMLVNRGVKVFTMPSRSSNMILVIKDKEENLNFNTLSELLLGQSVHVRWPHFKEAKVVAISDGNIKHELFEEADRKFVRKFKVSGKDIARFSSDINDIKERSLMSKGIDIGETSILAYVKLCLGRHYKFNSNNNNERCSVVKEWASNVLPFPFQTIVRDLPVQEGEKFQEHLTLNEYFTVGSTVYKATPPNYGSRGKVLAVANGAVKILFNVKQEADLEDVKKRQHTLSTKYYFGYQLAGRLGISSYLISRITSGLSIAFPASTSWPLGLRLRGFQKGVQGYTKYDQEFMYSSKTEKLLIEYMDRFPQVLNYLSSRLDGNHDRNVVFEATEMFKTENPKPKLLELQAWLKSLNLKSVPSVTNGSDSLDSAVVEAIDDVVKNAELKSEQEVTLEVRPSMLYKPQLRNTIVPDENIHTSMLDRVVIVREGYTVPLDMRGTVIGIIAGNDEREPMYEVMFDQPFISGNNLSGKCPELRGYTIPACMFLNLTQGQRNETRSLSSSSNVTIYHHNRQTKDETSNRRKNVGQFKPHAKSAFNKFNSVRQSSPQRDNRVVVRQQTPRMKSVPVSKSENIFESTWGALQSANNPSRDPQHLQTTLVTPPQQKNNRKQKNNFTKSQNLQSSTPKTLSILTQAAQQLPVVPKQTQNIKEVPSTKNHVQSTETQERAQESVDLKALNQLFQSAKIQKSPAQTPNGPPPSANTNSKTATVFAGQPAATFTGQSTTTFAGQSVSLSDLFKSAEASPSKYKQEGKNELNELLLREQKAQDKDGVKWSTADDAVEDETEETNDKQLEASSKNDPKQNDDDTRSSSVEDHHKQQISNVDLLTAECRKHKMMPPIYSYFNTPEKLTVTSLQLMNGVRFSSPALPSKEKSMENAAHAALTYMKQIPTPPVQQPRPENISYMRQPMFLNNAAFPQYGIPQIPPQHMMIPQQGHFHPTYHHPSVVPQYGFHPAAAPFPHANFRGMGKYFPPQPVTYSQNTGPYPSSYVLQNNAPFMQRSPSKQSVHQSTAFIPLQVARQQVSSVSPVQSMPVVMTTTAVSPAVTNKPEVGNTVPQKPKNTSPTKKPAKAKLAASFMNSQ